MRTALGHARGTYTAILDADLEYDPADIARLLEPLIAGDAQVVFGPRGFEAHSAYGFWYVVGNKIVTLVTNLLYNSWLADIMTCQKVMRTDLLRALPLRASGFTIEPEITARLLAAGHRIYEVPVTYRARGRQEGKKLTGSTVSGLSGRFRAAALTAGGATGRRIRVADSSAPTPFDLERLAHARRLRDWMFPASSRTQPTGPWWRSVPVSAHSASGSCATGSIDSCWWSPILRVRACSAPGSARTPAYC